MRPSIDAIRAWIEQACAEAVPARECDLGKHVIAGLQKTVTKDGKTLWLCPDAAERWGADDADVAQSSRQAVRGAAASSAPRAASELPAADESAVRPSPTRAEGANSDGMAAVLAALEAQTAAIASLQLELHETKREVQEAKRGIEAAEEARQREPEPVVVERPKSRWCLCISEGVPPDR